MKCFVIVRKKQDQKVLILPLSAEKEESAEVPCYAVLAHEYVVHLRARQSRQQRLHNIGAECCIEKKPFVLLGVASCRTLNMDLDANAVFLVWMQFCLCFCSQDAYPWGKGKLDVHIRISI